MNPPIWTPEQQTALITLCARAVQQQWSNPILIDPWSVQAAELLDLNYHQLRLPHYSLLTVVTRARTFDDIALAWQREHQQAIVLHLGCGLDSRGQRAHLPGKALWFDIDFPEVIEYRRGLYPLDGPCYKTIGSSIADLLIPAVHSRSEVLVLAEGLLMYLEPETIERLLHWLVQTYPSGQVVFDAISGLVARAARPAARASYRWSLDDPQAICRQEPRLKLVEEIPTSRWAAFDRMPLLNRLLIRALDRIPALMRMNRILIYRF